MICQTVPLGSLSLPTSSAESLCWTANQKTPQPGFLGTQVLQTHFEMGIQAAGFLAPSPAIETSTASCPVTALQLMQWICTNGSRRGKGTSDTRVQLTVQLTVLQRKESSSLPQSCIAPTMLRQRGAKPVAIKLLKTSDSKKDHLHGTALLYQELYSRLFDESHTLKAICPGL